MAGADGPADEGDGQAGGHDAGERDDARSLTEAECDDDGQHGADDRGRRRDDRHRAARQGSIEGDERQRAGDPARRTPPQIVGRRDGSADQDHPGDHEHQAGGLTEQCHDGAGDRP